MATLDPSNIVNGNTVEANDLLQLYQAFGTGSGASITGLAMTGSLYGNALTATTANTASYATTTFNINTDITGGGTHYLTFVAGSGSKAPKIASLLEYDASNNNLQVTSSYATTSSYTLGGISNSITGRYDNGTITQAGIFKVIAGAASFNPPFGATSSVFPELIGKTLGVNAWITANFGSIAPEAVVITNISSSGEILFDSVNGNPSSIIFTGFYI